MEGFAWIEPQRSCGKSGKMVANSWGRVSFTKKEGDLACLSIAFYENALKSLRWMVGDRVMVGYDEKAKMMAVKRVAVGGYALTKNGGGAKTNKVQKSARVTMSKPKLVDQRFDQLVFDKDSAQVVDGMLLIGLQS